MVVNDDEDPAAAVSDAFAAMYMGLQALAEALGEADPVLATRLEAALSNTIESCRKRGASIKTLDLLNALLESVTTGRQINEPG